LRFPQRSCPASQKTNGGAIEDSADAASVDSHCQQRFWLCCTLLDVATTITVFIMGNICLYLPYSQPQLHHIIAQGHLLCVQMTDFEAYKKSLVEHI
jgi:hypothetical protein